MSTPAKIIAISGPTASGKTSVAIALAQALNAEIISYDSRQVYKELRIGVARPNDDELHAAPHHLIAHRSILERYSVEDFCSEADQILSHRLQKNESTILVGGTGLNLQALIYGLDTMPDISEEIRLQIQKEIEEKGIAYIQNQVKELDYQSYQTIDIQNPRRLQRVLEIYRQHHLKLSDLKKDNHQERYDVRHVTVDIPREILYQRIDDRVRQMIADGLENEVHGLMLHRDLQAVHTIGYRELFDYFDGIIDFNTAINLIQQHSRNYAKRQMTWNKKYIPTTLKFNPILQSTEYILDHINASRS